MSRRPASSLHLVLPLLALLVGGCAERKELGAKLGAPLPWFGVTFAVERPQGEAGFTTWRARFDIDAKGFPALCASFGLDPKSPLLPLPWSRPRDGERHVFWRAGPETPPEACARPLGEGGWVAAKFEEGRSWLVVRDPGEEPWPEPKGPAPTRREVPPPVAVRHADAGGRNAE